MNFWKHGRLAIWMIVILFLLAACGRRRSGPNRNPCTDCPA